MAATTIPSISSILEELRARLPETGFVAGDIFSWNPIAKEVTYNPTAECAVERLLHESGHALAGHKSYGKDITLLEMERDAWEQAKKLGHELLITIDEDVAQNHLDDYRDWLHARSTCPNCQDTGIQTRSDTYACPACQNTWRVNEARTCQLRRYKTSI